MAKISNKPSIRFKGFTDAWEQRKLGDIASDMVAGGDIDKDLILAEGQYPVIANALTDDGIVGYYDKEYRVNAPAVTITGRGDVGHAKARLVNFTPVVRLLSVKSEHDVFFLENAINTLKIVIESTGVPQLTVPQLAKYEVAFPRQLDEEEHIGAFFKQLDHLITLHQRKVKSSFYQVLLKKLSLKITIDWEQRKLSELYRKVNEKNDLTYGKEDIISVANMYFKEDSYITDNEYLRTYNVFLLGDIAFEGNKSKDFKHGRFVENTIGNGIVSHVFDVFRPIMGKYDLLFWKYAINNERLMGQILVRSTKASTMMTNLVAADFLNEYFLVPKDGEQKAIGKTLNAIDNLITLHQRKQNIIITFKKYHFHGATWRHKTTTWEQRKLGDIASDMVAGGDIDKDLILAEGQYPVIANALTDDGIVGYYDKEYRVNAPAVTITGRGDVGHAKARLVNFTPVVRLLSVKSEHDVFFLENAINTLKIVIESTGVPQLTVPQLAKYEVAFPRQLDEEEHIGAFFKQLDHLITLHQRGKKHIGEIKNDKRNKTE